MMINSKRLLKSTLSVVLALCMVISCMGVAIIPTNAAFVSDSGVLGAFAGEQLGSTIDNLSYVKFHGNLTGYKSNGNAFTAWSDIDLTNDDGNHYYGEFYTAANQSQKEFGWNAGKTNDWGPGWFTMNGEHFTAQTTNDVTKDCKGSTNDKLSIIAATSGWVKVQIDFWGSYSSNTRVKFYQTAVSALTSSVAVGSSSLNPGQTTTITPTSSGGTGSPTNTIKVYSGSVNGTDVTSSVLSGTTFTAPSVSSSATYYVVNIAKDQKIGSYTKTSSSKTITVAPAETTYTVTVQSENTNYGTVGANSVTAGSNYTKGYLPTATPKYGYKFKEWTKTGNVTITNPTANDGTAYVNATSTGGTVTATFEADMSRNIYIVGSFRYRASDDSGWTYTYSSGGNWNDTSTNIKMTATSTPFLYKLETHASLAELSESIGDDTQMSPYFHIRDSAGSGQSFYPAATTVIGDSTSKTTLGTTGDQNMYFSSNLVDTPVTIYFQTNTKEIWYDVPGYYNVNTGSPSHGTVTASPSRAKANSTITLTLAPDNGYQLGSVSVKDASNNNVSLSGSGNTRTFTMPASEVTVTTTFTEITHSVTVKRRYYQTNETTLISEDSTAYQALTGVGIDTAKQTNNAPTVTNYSFWKFVLPSSGVTLASGDLNTSAAISVNATEDNTIYIYYKETTYNVTCQVNDTTMGSVKRGSSTITNNTTTKIGNVTDITLTAENNTGYAFWYWQIIPASGKTVTITDPSNSSSTAAITADTGSSEPTGTNAALLMTSSLKFRTNGTATVKAYFKPVNYSLNAKFTHNNSASWNSNTVSTTNTSGTTIQELNINDLFEVRVTLASGYAVDSVTFTSDSGFTSGTIQQGYPTTNNNVVTYRYKLTTTGDVQANVTLKAATPTFSSVKIRNRSQLNTAFSSLSNLASGTTVNHYYKQPVEAITTLDSFFTSTSKISYSNGTNSLTNKDSGEQISLAADNTKIPATKTGSITYTLTITATNSPEGVEPVSATRTYTISVTFNAAQKDFFDLYQLWSRCIEESTSGNAYYEASAPIAAYNSAYNTAGTYIGTGTPPSGYPDYDQGSSTAANAQLTAFRAAYDNLMSYAKKTTVYVLTKYKKNGSEPVNFRGYSNNPTDDDDYNHFVMYGYGLSSRINPTAEPDNVTLYHMAYEGSVTQGSNFYYLYSFTYAGKVNFNIWVGSSATSTTYSGRRLTGDVTGATTIGNSYYVNVYNINYNSTTTTAISSYTPFDHTKSSTKQLLEIGDTKTGDQIKGSSMFDIQKIGSALKPNGSNEIDTLVNEFKIYGPVGKAGAETVDLTQRSFTAQKQGKYTITYKTKFGKKADGSDWIVETTMTLWVAFDDISIYVDMNGNIGNPILNFKYYVNSQGEPDTQANSVGTAFLPYEMDLVTGSDSIYKYTIKVSKLNEDYKINFSAGTPIKINYITVEGMYVNTNGKSVAAPIADAIDNNAFEIGIDARITGEIWFKADSTNFKIFQTISYGSVTNTFMTLIEGSNSSAMTMLPSAIDSIHGTGIITDNDDEIYKVTYASEYTIDGEPKPVYNFGYVQNASAKQEVKYGDNTYYYFDKWVKFATPADGIEPTVNQQTNVATVNLSSVTMSEWSGSNSTDLHFLSAPEYSDGTADTTYVALYKPVISGDSTVRAEIVYHFKDYDTSDGNYVYNENKPTVDATYTKTVKIPVGSGNYSNFADVQTAAATIASTYMPTIVSNYFDYTFVSAVVDSEHTDSSKSKIVINATLHEDAHVYTIVVKNGGSVVRTLYGKYQQTQTLTSASAVNWTNNNGDVLAANTATYSARYVSGYDRNGSTDCQIIKMTTASGSSAHTSVIDNSYTEVFYEGSTEMLRHNFYIIDYCESTDGKFVGGGVLFGVMENGDFRQTTARSYLDTKQHRKDFITLVLNNDFETEYPTQTINNIGFRYKPYNSKEDVFRYSDELQAYTTIFFGTNVNSESYDGQTLRVFSFMVYDSNGTNVIVASEGYADVSRYQPQS